jgi:hypothetical protein
MPEEDVDPLLRRHTMVDSLQTTLEAMKQARRPDSDELVDTYKLNVINEELKRKKSMNVDDLDECLDQMHKDFAELETMQESLSIASKSSGLESVREEEMEILRGRNRFNHVTLFQGLEGIVEAPAQVM